MRFDFYSQRDTRDATTGDQAFQGINMTLDRSLLPQGMLALGQNTRTRTGRVCQRRGTNMPGDFNPPEGFGAVLVGSTVYRNPNGDEVMIVAPAGLQETILLQDGRDTIRTLYSVAEVGTGRTNGFGRVEFCQAFDKVVMFRVPIQPLQPNLVWDGTGDLNHDGLSDTKWTEMVLGPEGLTLVPTVWNGEPFMDRIVYYNAFFPAQFGRDEWRISDVLDYTSFDDIFQSFRTNAGEADYITRIMAYFRGSVIIFKNQSIHMATVNPTYPVSITQRILNSIVGSVGNKMPLMIGGDVIFLNEPNGFYLLSEVIQDQIAALPLPISEPIQRVIDGIFWPATRLYGCSAAIDNYAFFGVSTGISGGLNTILVYDTQRKVWESAGDTWRDPQFAFNALHVTNYQGARRLFALDYHRGIVYLLYEGVTDDMPGGAFHVPFKMETRGFTGDDPVSFKRFGRAIVGISTSDPSMSVTAISDGFNEEKVLTPTPITKDNTRFYVHGHKTFDPETDDADEPKREDYSTLDLRAAIAEDYEMLAVGPVTVIPGTAPQVIGNLQESLERLLVRGYGRWCSLRIENTQGVCEVGSVAVESTRAMNTNRTAA